MRRLLQSILTILLLSALGANVQSQTTKNSQMFNSFWTEFKAAVAKGDKEAVASMTRFPFYLDKELTKAEFIRKYNVVFNRPIQRCIARTKPTNDYQAYLKMLKQYPKQQLPKQDDTGSYSLYCGEEIYLFAIVDGKYKFTEIGVND